MKATPLFTLILLLSCDNDLKQRTLSGTPIVQSVQNSTSADTGSFVNQDFSRITYTAQGGGVTEIRNISYREEYLYRDKGFADYFVKETNHVRTVRGSDGANSAITLEIFTANSTKPIRTITLPVDAISLESHFLAAYKYGCCGAESRGELITLWQDNTFLTFNEQYYRIKIPNGGVALYFGYVSDARNEEQLIHGELQFAHESDVSSPGSTYRSPEFKPISKLVFKARTKELFDELTPFSPDIELLKHSENESVANQGRRQELMLWTYNKHEGLPGLDFDALKLTFQNGSSFDVVVPIKDGYMFGDSNKVKTILIGK